MKKALYSLVILVVLSVAYAFKSFTPPIFAANSVAELKTINIEGSRQVLLIRGVDKDNPVLLFLHGGPGMPAMYMAHDFQRALEPHFVMVQWDQRGAGKSYQGNTDVENFSTSRLLDDLDQVVDELRARFDQSRIWLVGHSHGSYLAAIYASKHPQKLHAFVGIGQVADVSREQAFQDRFLTSALNLQAEHKIPAAEREELLFQTGAVLHGETSFMPILLSGLLATEYSLRDILNVPKGSSLSSRHMQFDHPTGLIGHYRLFEIPVAIMMGQYDMTTPTALAEQYFKSITAPDKQWVLFEQSAHFPHFEEPELFAETMLELKNRWAAD